MRRRKFKPRELSGDKMFEAQQAAQNLAECGVPVELAAVLMGDWLRQRGYAITESALRSCFEKVLA